MLTEVLILFHVYLKNDMALAICEVTIKRMCKTYQGLVRDKHYVGVYMRARRKTCDIPTKSSESSEDDNRVSIAWTMVIIDEEPTV